MKRTDFAECTATAYMRQHGPEEQRAVVMNDMTIRYELGRDRFTMHSSLVPEDVDCFTVLTLSDGMFGQYPVSADDVVAHLLDPASNDIWDGVTSIILSTIADAIHGEVCNCDDKRCPITDEVYDWLQDGDPINGLTLADLVAMWKDYAEVTA